MELVIDRWEWGDAAPVRVYRISSRARPLASDTAALDGPALAASAAVSDEALMARYQRGDEKAFGQLYVRYRSRLLRFVRRMIPDPAECEEVVQETWMAVIRARERYAPSARFSTYLFSIARRRTMDRWRQRGRSPDTEPADEESEQFAAPTEAQPEQRLNTAALGEALVAAVSSLPLLQREAFLLSAEGGLSVEEIAQATGTGRETAKSRLRYALRRLRAAMEPWA